MLDKDPKTRATIEEIKKHPFLTDKQSNNNLGKTIHNLRNYHGNLKMKAGRIAISAIGRLMKKNTN